MSNVSFPNHIEHSLPNSVRYILLKYPGTVLAGGAVMSIFSHTKHEGDWDIFVNDASTISKIISEYYGNTGKILRQHMYANKSITFDERIIHGNIIQLIHKKHSCPEDILDTFDFNCCRHAICFSNKELKSISIDSSFQDLEKKKITINKVNNNPMITLNRIEKYVKRGYTMDKNEWVKFFDMVSKLDPEIRSKAILYQKDEYETQD